MSQVCTCDDLVNNGDHYCPIHGTFAAPNWLGSNAPTAGMVTQVYQPADDTGGERKISAGVYTSDTKPHRVDEARIAEIINRPIREPAPSADGRQREIDISNLRFYARMFREYKWETDVLSWTVFEHTLKTIADRLAAPAPVSGEGREKL